jgi:hypothetical protein
MNSVVRIAIFHTYSRSRPALTLFASFKLSPTPWFSWFNSYPTATRWETNKHKEHRSWGKESNGAALPSMWGAARQGIRDEGSSEVWVNRRRCWVERTGAKGWEKSVNDTLYKKTYSIQLLKIDSHPWFIRTLNLSMWVVKQMRFNKIFASAVSVRPSDQRLKRSKFDQLRSPLLIKLKSNLVNLSFLVLQWSWMMAYYYLVYIMVT